MYLGLPQISYLALVLLGAGIALAKHGEPRRDKYNFWTSMLSEAIVITILYCGGFFTRG